MSIKFRAITQKLNDELNAVIGSRKNDIRRFDVNVLRSGASSSSLFLMAHHSHCGTVHSYVFNYLEAMQKAGCDAILISTSPHFSDSDAQRLRSVGVGLIVRRNIGYDFGSWRTAIDLCPTIRSDYETIIFGNDSVYGPFTDISVIIDEMKKRRCDIWSLTSSQEIQYHLQSYFWGISNEGLKGPFFDYFWHEYYRYHSLRRTVIDRYETKLLQIAVEKFGLKFYAYCDVEDIIKEFKNSPVQSASAFSESRQYNPTHHFWKLLLEHYSFPFVKRELLKGDPFGVASMDSVEAVVRGMDAEVWKMAKDHLNTLKRIRLERR